MEPHPRELAWEGCLNVRDLGGHSTADGGETRYGAIVRADSVRQLTDAGRQAAVHYGIKTIVDLRTDDELQADPPADLPVEVVHVSMFGDESPALWKEVEAAARRAPDAIAATSEAYLVFLEHSRPTVAAAMGAVARAPAGGVVVHCLGGKDRTGLLTAFLLHLAGVDTEQIASDYALSEERLRPRHEAWLAHAATEAERERIRQSARTPAASIAAVFAELERRYGSVAEYLRAGGLGDDDIERARSRVRA